MSARPSGDQDDPTAPAGQPLDPLDEDVGFEHTRRTDPLVGRMLGEYRVEERLGHGGMGLLYRGVQPVIGKPVAIKVVLQEIATDSSVALRMLEEARAANAVRHPNIVDIFSLGQLPDGRPYMVMELLDGQPLSELLRFKGHLSADETMTVLSQTMAALVATHAVGVIHRDLKPENIFVTKSAEGTWWVKIIDFGLAKREGKNTKLTRPGMVMGTPAFMAPEQVRGDEHLTGLADVYSMGIVAWTLLMGREPFVGGSVVELMHQHLSAPVPPLGREAGELPEGLEALVLRMMAKDPASRPDASEVRGALGRLIHAPRLRPGVNPLAVAVALTAVLGLSSALLWAGLREDEPVSPAEKPAIGPPPRRIAQSPVGNPEPLPAPVVDAGAAVAITPAKHPPAVKDNLAEQTWPCKTINDVSPVRDDLGSENAREKYRFFAIYFDYSTPLLVHITNNSTADRNAIQNQRDAFAACRGTAKTLNARRIRKDHPGFTTRGKGLEVLRFLKGDVVYWQDVWLTKR